MTIDVSAEVASILRRAGRDVYPLFGRGGDVVRAASSLERAAAAMRELGAAALAPLLPLIGSTRTDQHYGAEVATRVASAAELPGIDDALVALYGSSDLGLSLRAELGLAALTPTRERLTRLLTVRAGARRPLAALGHHVLAGVDASVEASLVEVLDVDARARAELLPALALADGDVARRLAARYRRDRDAPTRVAAAYAALISGDRAALAELLTAAREGRGEARLAALGWCGAVSLPEVEAPIVKALGDSKPRVRVVACSVAAHIGTRAALEALLRLMRDTRRDVAEQAAGCVREVAGDVERAATLAASWREGLRYRDGALLTLPALADSLTRPGNTLWAAHDLVAMTGERHGVDPHGDVVTNARAIATWRARAAALAPAFEPGAWYWLGSRVEGA